MPCLPTGVWIIDAPIDVLGEHAHWIRDAQSDELAVHQRIDRIVEVAHGNRYVAAEPECIEPVDPDVVTSFRAAGIGHRPEPAPRPSFGLTELLVAIHTSRQSCYKAGKARIFSPVRESSGESRLSCVNMGSGRGTA